MASATWFELTLDELARAQLLRLGGRRGLFAGSFELTERCNLRCVHCYINQPAGSQGARDRELSTPQVANILDQIAGAGCLHLLLTGSETLLRPDFSIAPPAAHAMFMASGDHGDLTLAVRDGRLREVNGWRPLCTSCEPWQLWQDVNGCYVFAAGQNSRFRQQITVDAGFRSGEVLVELERPENEIASLYPLADLDIILFANWLADSGDLILHASGVEFEGRSYCFVGASGAGKSTIAAAFSSCSNATLLGEDNLVLRCVNGRFWICGTPWHLNSALCSPRGAPLEKLFFLDRSFERGIRRCQPLHGIAGLLQTAFVPYYRHDVLAKILDNLARLAEQVPFYTLSYRLGSDVLALVRDA